MPIVVHSGLFRKGLTGYAIIPKERLSGVALAKPEKMQPWADPSSPEGYAGQEDAV